MSNNISEMLKKLEACTETLRIQSDILNEVIEESIKKAPEDKKDLFENLSASVKRSLALASQGKVKESEEELNKIRNASKSNK